MVWETLRRIAGELRRLQVPYAVVGGIALQNLGIQRSTQDVDILVSENGLRKIHQSLIGRGYRLKSETSRHLRDDISLVRIEFLITGKFPGDGQPKPVRFPDPVSSFEESDDGIRFINLKNLVEMKLASAKSAPHRIKDRADVLELIHALKLPPAFAEKLNPYVQDEFRQLAALPPPSEPD